MFNWVLNIASADIISHQNEKNPSPLAMIYNHVFDKTELRE